MEHKRPRLMETLKAFRDDPNSAWSAMPQSSGSNGDSTTGPPQGHKPPVIASIGTFIMAEVLKSDPTGAHADIPTRDFSRRRI